MGDRDEQYITLRQQDNARGYWLALVIGVHNIKHISPERCLLDPAAKDKIVQAVVTLPGNTSLPGLTPVGPGTYAISGGNHTYFGFAAGSMKAYIVSLAIELCVGTGLRALCWTLSTSMMNSIAAIPLILIVNQQGHSGRQAIGFRWR